MSIADFCLHPAILNEPLSRRLRVGVILDTLSIPKWMREILNAIELSTVADLVLIVKADCQDGSSVGTAESFPALFKLWQRLDFLFYRPRSKCPECFDILQFAPQREHLEIIEFQTTKRGNKSSLNPVDLLTLKGKNLDLLIQISGSLDLRQLGNVAPYGVWSFQKYDQLTLELFWAMLNDKLTIDHGIDIAPTTRQSNRLNRICDAVDPISLFRNFSNLCSKRSLIVDQTLREIHAGRWRSVLDSLQSRKTFVSAPGNLATARLLTKLLIRATSQKIRDFLFREQWFLAFTPKHRPVDGKCELTLIRAPYDRFYADPFVIDRGEKSYIFFEDYSFSSRKGVISFVEIDQEKRCSLPEPVLEEPYHLSYPCLFEWQGEIYLLPESKENRTVQIYRATEFPRKWELAHVLLKDVAAVDATLLRYRNKFWLFTSGIGTSDPWFDGKSELSLFYSESLSGPWISHPGNPVVCDIRRSRQAGHVYLTGGQIIRPAQDYSAADGYAVTLNLIDLLSPSEYHETPVAHIRPGWMKSNLGTHTFNRSERYEVLDGRVLMSPLSRFRSRVCLENVKLTKSLIEPI